MRILTALGIFDEVGPSLYQGNTISEWLGQPGQANGFRVMYERKKPRSTEFSSNRLNSPRLIFPIAANVFSLWKNNRFTQFPNTARARKVHSYGLIR